jgi:hypothetical protein
MYVAATGMETLNAPVEDVVTVGSGDAGTPHGMVVAVCAALHVVALGVAPTFTVKPASAAPEA